MTGRDQLSRSNWFLDQGSLRLRDSQLRGQRVVMLGAIETVAQTDVAGFAAGLSRAPVTCNPVEMDRLL